MQLEFKKLQLRNKSSRMVTEASDIEIKLFCSDVLDARPSGYGTRLVIVGLDLGSNLTLYRFLNSSLSPPPNPKVVK